jgi:uncharacterized protein with HEPN domain
MQRDPRAYFSEILEAIAAIDAALEDVDLALYRANRLVRSAVEREFIIIGEAMIALSHHAPHLFEKITNARRVVNFRNQLTHEYLSIDDEIVWAVAKRDNKILRSDCEQLLAELNQSNP